MKLSLSQQLLGAFALAAVLSMGVVAPAAARDNQRSEHADKDKKHDKRSEEHTSELQSLMRISYAVFCLKKKNNNTPPTNAPPTSTQPQTQTQRTTQNQTPHQHTQTKTT